MLPAVGGYTMKHSRYIFQSAKAWVTGRTREANGCHGKKRESGPKGADKPPPRKKCIILNRNAKFTPIFSRGEFGVFQYAHFSSVRKEIIGTGCRDPPINRQLHFVVTSVISKGKKRYYLLEKEILRYSVRLRCVRIILFV